MDTGFEQKVRERAYELWMASGMGDGMAVANWCAAERDLSASKAKPKMAAAKATASKVRPVKAKLAAKPRASKSGPIAAAIN